MSRNNLFPITVIMAVIVTNINADENCSVSHSVGMQLAIDSRRNDSGHWISQVELIHSDSGERKGDPWTMDVHHRTSSCGDDSPGEVIIGATLISPQIVSVEEPENKKKRVIGENLGDIGVQHRFDRTMRFLFSNTSVSWYNAREDCYHFNCTLVQTEIHSRTTLSYVNEFVKSNGEIHTGFQQRIESPHDIIGLTGKTIDPDTIGPHWAAGQPPATRNPSTHLCVTYNGVSLSTGPCNDRHHFMCVCHKQFTDSLEYDDDE